MTTLTRYSLERRIYFVRGHKVMIDEDLANVYGVSTKRLNQQVRRNRRRFPADFMFQVTLEESKRLRLQIATSKKFKIVFDAIRQLMEEPGRSSPVVKGFSRS
jgi:hypothetical protein